MREIAQQVRAAIRFMGRELAASMGEPESGEEMANDLEIAFLEGRMSVNDDGRLEVLIPDDEEDGMYYKLNLSSGADGSMRVWTEGANGEQMDMVLDDWEDDEPTVGLFGLTNEGTEGSVNIFNGDEAQGQGEDKRLNAKKGKKKKTSGAGLFGGKR